MICLSLTGVFDVFILFLNDYLIILIKLCSIAIQEQDVNYTSMVDLILL